MIYCGAAPASAGRGQYSDIIGNQTPPPPLESPREMAEIYKMLLRFHSEDSACMQDAHLWHAASSLGPEGNTEAWRNSAVSMLDSCIEALNPSGNKLHFGLYWAGYGPSSFVTKLNMFESALSLAQKHDLKTIEFLGLSLPDRLDPQE